VHSVGDDTVDESRPKVQSQITFLYYRDLQPVSEFYREIMGFELVEDQGWAKILRVSGNAYLGIVDEERGFCKAQEASAVLITLIVDDVSWWHDYLRRSGVGTVSELQTMKGIAVQCFFLEDPGGYTIEIQQFLEPEVARTFH